MGFYLNKVHHLSYIYMYFAALITKKAVVEIVNIYQRDLEKTA